MDSDHADPAAAGQLHHLELNSPEPDRSFEFWNWLLQRLGYEAKNDFDSGYSWINGPTYVVLKRAEPGPPHERRAPGLDHFALHAPSRDVVDGLADGVRSRDDATLLYPDRHPYAGGYYALYCRSPEEIVVEVVGPE